jgi:hypothetical protein
MNIYHSNIYLQRWISHYAESDQKLLETLADWAINLDYNYIVKLFYKYHNNVFRSHNDKKMFECLIEVIDNYNSLGNGRVII